MKEKLQADIAKLVMDYEDATEEILGCVLFFPIDKDREKDQIFEFNGERFQNVSSEGYVMRKVIKVND